MSIAPISETSPIMYFFCSLYISLQISNMAFANDYSSDRMH